MGSAALQSISSHIRENNKSSKKVVDEKRGSFDVDHLDLYSPSVSVRNFHTRSMGDGNGPGNEEKTLLDTYEERRIDLGETHHLTLEIMKALAKYYCKEGSFEKALPLLQSCLSVSVLTFGASSIETLSFMNELGNVHYKQGNYALALPLYTTCLEKRQISEGTLSVLTLISQNNVGLCLMHNEEKLLEAKKLMKDCLEKRRKVLGIAHTDTLHTQAHLASLYKKLHNYEKSIVTYKDILDKKGHHPASTNLDGDIDDYDTLSVMHALAGLYFRLKQYDLAEGLYTQCWEQQKNSLHPDALKTLYNLALLRTKQGRTEEAIANHVTCLTHRRASLGDDNPVTIMSMKALAALYISVGMTKEAEPLRNEILRNWKTYGSDFSMHEIRY